IKLTIDKSTLIENSTASVNCTTDTTPEDALLIYTPGITPHALIIYDAGECNVTIYEPSILSYCNCVSNKIFTCVSKRLNRTIQGDPLQCRLLSGTVSNSVQIQIKVPVQYASIPRYIRDRITVNENKLASLVCQANGIPAANITWFWDNSILSTSIDDVQIVYNISQAIKGESDKTFSVTSNLTLNVNRSHNRRVIYCRARNVNSELKIILPTTGILISGGRDFYMIRNSPTIQRLECSIKGGNPYADLHWSCYNGNQIKFNDSSGAISAVTWKAELNNDSICTCTASHDLGWTNPPTPPLFQINTCRNKGVENGRFIKVVRGNTVDIDCSSSGNPPPTYFWSDSLQSSKLFIKNVSEHHAFEYFCTANNIMDASNGKNPPKITRRTTPVVVLEGSNISLSCDSKPGNPNVTSLSWTSTEQPYRDTSDQYLIIQNISRTEEDKASIKTFTALNTIVNHGDNLTFACDVDSDPPANITIVSPTGARLEYIEGKNKLHFSKSSSCLEDIGSPIYPSDYNQITTVEGRLGEKAVLNFRVFSNPPPINITWANISNSFYIPIDTNSLDRVIINTSDNMSSTLVITNIKPWDAGNYFVRVENELGSKNETFHIVIDNKSTTIATPTINFGAVVGGPFSALTGVVIIAVVVFVFYRRITNNRHKSRIMETGFDNILPITDETPKYEEEQNLYGNIQTKDAFWKALTIKTLRDTVRQLKRDPVPLFKEFYTLQMDLKYDTKEALKPNNVAKNRYRNDASRAVLPFLRGDSDSDFINASYIDGYCKPRKYIAAQGPLENTICDTWRMIHSEDIKIIVMVTNIMEFGKKKCFKYWPDDRATYGKCNVKLDQIEEYADFVVRHFTYNMEGPRFERKLIQFQYTSWPDINVPGTALSLVQFWRKVRQSELVEYTPWMVHCSAGVGRTGSFIAIDYLYEQGKVDGKLNIPDTVNVLREQRMNMVQTKEQYLYLHEVITELLDPIGQIVNPEKGMRLQSTVNEYNTLNKEFKAITESIVSVKTVEGDCDLNRMPDGLLPENICKSIDKNVIPDDMYRPLLSSGNDFINAVYIPTYRENEKYIVTQFPLQNTVNDFVRLLWDHNILDVVLLDEENEERHCYWPHNKNPLCLGPFVISLLSVDDATNWTTRIIDITLAEKRQSKKTVVHQFTAWPDVNLCEEDTLANFLQKISSIAGPVVVQCHDGYSRSGLFAALLCTVDRIKTDNEVAIADTVRLVKQRRKAAVTNMEQYTFCHEVVVEYLKRREKHTEEKEDQQYVKMTNPAFKQEITVHKSGTK
ncbi:PTPRT-like protein, partial [Mya arenaria]